MTHTALIVDDEPDIRELLEITLGRMDIDTHSAEDVTSARNLLAECQFDLCITDMKLPDGNGIELVEYIQTVHPEIPVAVLTAFGSMDAAVSALKAGAFDFVSKPVDLQRLRDLVNTALKLPKEQAAVTPSPVNSPILGESEAINKLQKQITKLARSQAPVYIFGESGVGKELVATLIHDLGPRAEGPFVPVNCGAIPGELMESEFFGHKKGSFTGAIEDKTGLFQAANGGTLFLDEVADLPLHMQVKLLRVIQEKAVRPVGTQKEISVDVRILSATHKDLVSLVEAGEFRQDLFYRINVIQLTVPPLRERQGDIILLANHFITEIAEEWGMDIPALSDEAIQALRNYPFPGNVRELENVLERALTLCDNDLIEVEHLQLDADSIPTPAEPRTRTANASASTPAPVSTDHAGGGLPEFELGNSLEDYLSDIEKQAILKALEETRWNRTAAAKKLGMSFRSLRYRLKKLGIDDNDNGNG